jgi:hypothetical protein
MKTRIMERLLAAALFTASALPAACGADTPAGPADPSTVYELTAINGHPLPAVLGENPTGKAEVLAESYTLEPDGSYRRVQTYRNTDADGVKTGTLTQSGTYVTTTDVILFTLVTDQGTFVTPGSLSGGLLTVRFAAQGITLVYTKR